MSLIEVVIDSIISVIEVITDSIRGRKLKSKIDILKILPYITGKKLSFLQILFPCAIDYIYFLICTE